jgi:hypothetical protein
MSRAKPIGEAPDKGEFLAYWESRGEWVQCRLLGSHFDNESGRACVNAMTGKWFTSRFWLPVPKSPL